MSDDGPKIRVLVVEDDDQLRKLFRIALEDAGFEVETASTGLEAIELLAHVTFQVDVSDVVMPMDGVALLRVVNERALEVPVVLVSGQPELDTASKAVQYGACQYLFKPVALADLVKVVTRAAALWEFSRLRREAVAAVAGGIHAASDRIVQDDIVTRAMAGLWIAFQPIVRVSDRSLFAYEALLRTTNAVVSDPSVLLQAAEKIGRLDVLGRAVRTKASQGFAAAPEHALLFVNLHPLDLDDATLAWESTPLAKIANRVVLEVTERASLDRVQGVRQKFAELRALGFRLAIDDLGSGYSGLTSFVDLEPEFVKFDMALTRDIHRSPTKQALLRGMTSVCKTMGMTVVAEGVESADERDTLIDCGCDLLQGYLFARPGPAFPDFQW